MGVVAGQLDEDERVKLLLGGADVPGGGGGRDSF